MNIIPVFVGVTSGAVIAVGLSFQLNKIKKALDKVDQHLRALAAQQAAQQVENESIRTLHGENEDPDRNIS